MNKLKFHKLFFIFCVFGRAPAKSQAGSGFQLQSFVLTPRRDHKRIFTLILHAVIFLWKLNSLMKVNCVKDRTKILLWNVME